MEPDVLNRLRRVAGKQTTRLTHYGRKTGKPHEVTIWFVLDGDRLYIGTANVKRQWVSLDPQLADGHVSLGLVYGEKYDYVRAAEQSREATRLEPDNGQAWVALSWALGYEQPPNAIEAEKTAREAIRLQPSLFGAYYELGRALLLQQRFPEAIAAMEHAKELSPDSTTPDAGLAQVYLAQGDYDRCMALLLKRGSPKSALQLYLLASVYAARGSTEKALATLEETLDKGYRDFAAIDASPYFSKLRSDPRFQELIQRYRR